MVMETISNLYTFRLKQFRDNLKCYITNNVLCILLLLSQDSTIDSMACGVV